MSLLQVVQLTKRFGGLEAVSSLDFHVDKGEIVGIIGPNGAGKTTLFNIISGTIRPTLGEVLYKEEDITALPTHVLAAKGIVRTFQSVTLFPDYTVLDNVFVATHLSGPPSVVGTLFMTGGHRSQQHRRLHAALKVLEFIGLTGERDELAKNLPHGHQRRLGVAIALAARPETLLLDEPMTGMNTEEVKGMMRLVKRINEEGITILLVEHHMTAVMDLCKRLVVLNFGMKIAEGTPDDVSKNEEVIKAYLGTKH
jgi:branched-chain amino acid transport system ATP-binding protein